MTKLRRLLVLLMAIVLAAGTSSPALAEEDWVELQLLLVWEDQEIPAVPIAGSEHCFWAVFPDGVPECALLRVSHPLHSYAFDPADGSELSLTESEDLAAETAIVIQALSDGLPVDTFMLFVSSHQLPTPTSEPTPEPTPEPVHYVIPEDATAGPVPDESCYGAVSIDEPEQILAVIQDARDRGLLREDETVAFDPTVEFYRGVNWKDIEYYLDDTILVILWKETIDGKCCSFAEIKIADPSQFRRMLADNTYNAPRQYLGSELAARANAVVAMNADFYQRRDMGIVVWNRELCRMSHNRYNGAYQMYNCIETLFVDAQGNFHYKPIGEENTEESLRQYIEDNDILFSVAFGPVLVENGEARTCEWYPLGEAFDLYSRAGIGMVDECHYLYMSLNHGSQPARWTVNEFARHFAEKPVFTAYCMDGGQTGQVVFRNTPYSYMDYGEERVVSDILYFVMQLNSMFKHGSDSLHDFGSNAFFADFGNQ